MKLTFGVIAGLLFVSTVAVGQYGGGSPFPQAANPALRNGEFALPVISPSSMAAHQSGTNDESTPSLAWHQKVETGSPFPQAANPSLGSGTSGQTSPSGNVDTGSPFPQAASPSRGGK
jgi:hypothetical protein